MVATSSQHANQTMPSLAPNCAAAAAADALAAAALIPANHEVQQLPHVQLILNRLLIQVSGDPNIRSQVLHQTATGRILVTVGTEDDPQSVSVTLWVTLSLAYQGW
jgi:hypothetical protein